MVNSQSAVSSAPLKKMITITALLAVLMVFQTMQARAQDYQQGDQYTSSEILSAGQNFFGAVSGGLASVLEKAISNYGLPNGYILGEEGSAAIIGGLRYGEGMLHTKNAGSQKVFWQGPSVGWDFGGDGNRTMMLVYNLPSMDYIYRRWVGIAGSAYLVGGFGLTALHSRDGQNQHYYIVPVRSGVGARLGVNVGYLKFTPRPTWNPF